MKFKWNKKYLYWGFTAFIVIIACMTFEYVIYNSINLKSNIIKILKICTPITNGLILAYLLTPIVNFYEKKLLYPFFDKIKYDIGNKKSQLIRAISLTLTLFSTFLLIYIFILIVIPKLYESIENITIQFPTYANNIIGWLDTVFAENEDLDEVATQLWLNYSEHINSWFNNTLLPAANDIIKTLSLSLLGFLQAAWNLLLGLIISIYIMSKKEVYVAQCKKVIYAFSSTIKKADERLDDLRFVNKTFGGFISGKLLDSLIIGIICFICTSIIGTPYAVLISVIIGITNIIPFFGPYLGAIPASILILMVDPLQCVYFVIFILILQQVDGNIIGPRILGDSTGLSGFWVIFSITLFGGILGISGMIIGVPTFAVIYSFIRRKVNMNLEKKGLPVDVNVFKQQKTSLDNLYRSPKKKEQTADIKKE